VKLGYINASRSGSSRIGLAGLSGPSDDIVWSGEGWVKRSSWVSQKRAGDKHLAAVANAVGKLLSRAAYMIQQNPQAANAAKDALRSVAAGDTAGAYRSADRIASMISDTRFAKDINRASSDLQSELAKIDMRSPSGSPRKHPAFSTSRGMTAGEWYGSKGGASDVSERGDIWHPEGESDWDWKKWLPWQTDDAVNFDEDKAPSSGGGSGLEAILGGQKLTVKLFWFYLWLLAMIAGGVYVTDKLLPKEQDNWRRWGP